MANAILWIILGAVVGYFIAKYFVSKQKFGDKEARINAEWEKKITNIEKDYEIKLEKSKSSIEKKEEETKTKLEELDKKWQVRFIQTIEELKTLFKESEKKIREKSVSSSRRSLVGKFIERFVPFLKKIPYAPSDMHFLGQPVDYIVFEGLRDDNIEKVGFIEVKTGNGALTKREKSLKETIEKKKVFWKEIHVETDDKETPDKEIESGDETLKELYEDIDKKIASVGSKELSEESLLKSKLKDKFEKYFVNLIINSPSNYTLILDDSDRKKISKTELKERCSHVVKNITEEINPYIKVKIEFTSDKK